MSVYLVPAIMILITLYTTFKKVKIYDCFLDGTKETLSLVKRVFPYIATIYIVIILFKKSGLSVHLGNALSTPLSYLGIPKECYIYQ